MHDAERYMSAKTIGGPEIKITTATNVESISSGAPSGRHPIRESAILGWYILRNWFLPNHKSMVPYSIQWLMRLKPAWFRYDLLTLFDLLQQKRSSH